MPVCCIDLVRIPWSSPACRFIGKDQSWFVTNFGMEGGFLLEKLEDGGRSSSPSPLSAFPRGTRCWVSLGRSRDPLWKTCPQTCCVAAWWLEQPALWEQGALLCRWKVEQQQWWVLDARWNSTKQKDVKPLHIGELRQVNRRAAELLLAWKATAEARSRDRKQGNLTHRWLCVV